MTPTPIPPGEGTVHTNELARIMRPHRVAVEFSAHELRFEVQKFFGAPVEALSAGGAVRGGVPSFPASSEVAR